MAGDEVEEASFVGRGGGQDLIGGEGGGNHGAIGVQHGANRGIGARGHVVLEASVERRNFDRSAPIDGDRPDHAELVCGQFAVDPGGILGRVRGGHDLVDRPLPGWRGLGHDERPVQQATPLPGGDHQRRRGDRAALSGVVLRLGRARGWGVHIGSSARAARDVGAVGADDVYRVGGGVIELVDPVDLADLYPARDARVAQVELVGSGAPAGVSVTMLPSKCSTRVPLASGCPGDGCRVLLSVS